MNIPAKVLFPFLFIPVISVEETKPIFHKRTESQKKSNVQRVPAVCQSLSQHCVVVISFGMDSVMLILQRGKTDFGWFYQVQRKQKGLTACFGPFPVLQMPSFGELCWEREVNSADSVDKVNFLSTSLNMIVERRHFNQVAYMIIHGVRIRSNLAVVVKSQRSQ